MTALLATIGRAAAWFTRGSTPRAGEPRPVDGLWEMLTPAERKMAFDFEGDDTIGQR
jgi:hypothetical protein